MDDVWWQYSRCGRFSRGITSAPRTVRKVIVMLLAVLQDWFWLVWAFGTIATLLVVSGWNWILYKQNKQDHAAVTERISRLEEAVRWIRNALYNQQREDRYPK